MSDLYETDFLLWTERQAELLRRRAAGELVNDADLDWPNIAEEIDSSGRNDIRAVRSLLVQAFAHDLKADAWPLSREAPGWRAEALRFRQEASDFFSPSMRSHIDVANLYRRALRLLPVAIDGQDPLPVPQQCSITLDALLADE